MKSDNMPPTGWSSSGRKSDLEKPDFSHTCGALNPQDSLYPKQINALVRKPPTLYWRGDLNILLSPNMLSVVGSRTTTSMTQRALTTIIGPIKEQQLTIVSGLAIGLDALAHIIALENNLPTIAILGSSVEHNEIYPRCNTPLAEQIVEQGGLLLSPFPPGTPIEKYNFPIRNQLIAALSSATLVASAAKKSGALITSQLALEYGKDVWVIPGPIYEPLYGGSNILFQDGAAPILSHEQILDYFQLTRLPQKKYTDANESEQCIIALLREKSASINELCARLAQPNHILAPSISKMELKGWLTCSIDGEYSLK